MKLMPTTVAIVGAGRVGRTLGRKLRELGWNIGPVVTRSAATARAAVRAIAEGVPHAGLTRQILAADVVLLATPDYAVADVAARLARQGGEEWRGKVVLHTSGSLSRDALNALTRCGASTGSMHPMQTFSGRGRTDLEGVIFGIDGDARALRVGRQIARALGGVPVVVNGANRVAYHAAGGFAAQHVLSVMEAGTRILMSVGFTRRLASRALLNLARQTLDNFERLGPRATWTGPLARGDFGTVEKHMAALRRLPREYREVYASLTRLAVAMLAAQDTRTRRRLARILRK
jgi:predicted short-subunit dehydrogenase-like oxidoreductase (DUF2520 family)